MMVTAGIGVLFNLLIGGLLHLVCRSAGHQILASHGHSHAGHMANSKEAESGSISSLDQHTMSSSFSSSIEVPQNLNIRAAFVHVLGDLVQSLGVLVAAILIKFTGFALADPICTFLFSALVLLTTIPVFGDTIAILVGSMERKKTLNTQKAQKVNNNWSKFDLH